MEMEKSWWRICRLPCIAIFIHVITIDGPGRMVGRFILNYLSLAFFPPLSLSFNRIHSIDIFNFNFLLRKTLSLHCIKHSRGIWANYVFTLTESVMQYAILHIEWDEMCVSNTCTNATLYFPLRQYMAMGKYCNKIDCYELISPWNFHIKMMRNPEST